MAVFVEEDLSALVQFWELVIRKCFLFFPADIQFFWACLIGIEFKINIELIFFWLDAWSQELCWHLKLAFRTIVVKFIRMHYGISYFSAKLMFLRFDDGIAHKNICSLVKFKQAFCLLADAFFEWVSYNIKSIVLDHNFILAPHMVIMFDLPFVKFNYLSHLFIREVFWALINDTFLEQVCDLKVVERRGGKCSNCWQGAMRKPHRGSSYRIEISASSVTSSLLPDWFLDESARIKLLVWFVHIRSISLLFS